MASKAKSAKNFFISISPYKASGPVSPVRMRITCSRSCTKILPSPILPVWADFSIASITRSSWSALMAASSLILGRKSTTYSAPRYSSVWPFCRPKPLTSVTVMPCTPMADKASRTSSSLNGLMIAVTIFIFTLLELSGASSPRWPDDLLERAAQRQHRGALAQVLAQYVVERACAGGRVGLAVSQRYAVAGTQILGDAQLVVTVGRIGAGSLERIGGRALVSLFAPVCANRVAAVADRVGS